MAERPGGSLQNPLASKLAERYGMTADNVDELLTKTQSEYSGTLPPVTPSDTPIEQAAANIGTTTTTRVKSGSEKSLSGGLLAAIFVVLLIALGVALSFQKGCFHQRDEAKAPAHIDTIQSILKQQAEQASTPPIPPSTTNPNDVPPEALVVPREEPPGTSGKPSSSGITSATQSPSTLRTSSNFEAEERLAELRANGYARAHMKTIKRRGSVTYIVSPN
jgi:hypothetical protein